MWFLNSPVLQRLYNVADYYGWVAFVQTRFVVYEVMFLILSLVCFWSTNDKAKALCSFTVVMVSGSILDKAVFGERGYIWTDLVLIVLGLIVAKIVYGRTKRMGFI